MVAIFVGTINAMLWSIGDEKLAIGIISSIICLIYFEDK